MNIPSLNIGNLKVKLPIIQGGMGIGVSASKLAGAVAAEGGIGVISGVQIGYKEKDFLTNTLQANLRALSREIKEARERSNNGVIGVNLMVAMKNYKELAQEAVKNKIDVIISGAGLPLELPKIVKGSSTKIIPIVSSGKAARVILKRWQRDEYVPDAIIIEGPKAGGHLGFKASELLEHANKSLEEIFTEVKAVVSQFEETLKVKIPIIVAGGIMNGKDIANMISMGADGVQMGTRFVTTYECDASQNFKDAYLKATDDDAKIIKSPVGMPGRAIMNNFIETTQKERIPVKSCFGCLSHCNPAQIPFCISQALMDSVMGKEGLVFSGARVGSCVKMQSVNEVFSELKSEMTIY